MVSVAANSESEAATLWVAREGKHRIQITVDPAGRVGEASDGNNAAELVVTVAGPTPKGSFPLDWVLLVVGVVALLSVVAAFAWQFSGARQVQAAGQAAGEMRLYRVKAGHDVACGKCGKKILSGQQYYKCGCDTRYHVGCAPSGLGPRCAGEEEE